MPDLRGEFGPVGDDQVLQTVGTGAGQLFIVLLHAPVELIVQLCQQNGTENLVVLSKDVHNGV